MSGIISYTARVLRSAIALLASAAVVVQPVLAQSITPLGGARVVDAPNGVPLVMIEAPNAQGVSHNTYDRFDVDTRGVVLNNIDTNYGLTGLAGFVPGNANLKNGAASLIINEVTGADISELDGYVEVGGARADVVIANPYGITCNGCGFINTDHAVLTTGALVMSEGALRGFDVERGVLAIGELGANASGVSQFDLIARKVTFAGSVHGQRVRVIAGRNDVIFATGEATAKAPDGSSSPELAIDSTVFGGMYANKITIVSTEAGVGVRAPQKMSAGAGGMRITADGRLVMGAAVSSGGGAVQSYSDNVVVTKTVQTLEPLSLQAKKDLIVEADAVIVSEATADLSAGGTFWAQPSAQIISGSDLRLFAQDALRLGENVVLAAKNDLALRGGELEAQAGAVLYAGHAGAGEVPGAGGLTVDLTGEANLSGTNVFATGELRMDVGTLLVSGAPGIASRIISAGDASISAGAVAFGNTQLEAGGGAEIAVRGLLDLGAGASVVSGGDTDLTAQDVLLSGANLQAGGASAMRATGAISGTDTLVAAQNRLVLDAGSIALRANLVSFSDRVSLDSRAGALAVDGIVAATEDIGIAAAGAAHLQGALRSGDAIDISADSILSTAQVLAAGDVRLTSLAGGVTYDGAMQSEGRVSVTSASDVHLDGSMLAGLGIAAVAQGDMQAASDFATSGDLHLAAQGVLNTSGAGAIAEAATARNLRLSGSEVIHSGAFIASGTLDVTAYSGAFYSEGDLTAGGAVTLEAATDLRVLGALAAGGDISLATASGDITQRGVVRADGSVSMVSGGDLHAFGAIYSAGHIQQIAARNLTNAGDLRAAAAISLQSGADLTNAGGMVTQGGIHLSAPGHVINSGMGLAATGASAASLIVQAGSIVQSGDVVVEQSILLRAGSGDLEVTGELAAGASIALEAADRLGIAADLTAGERLTAQAQGILSSGELKANLGVRLISGTDGLSHNGLVFSNGQIRFVSDGDIAVAGSVQSAAAGIAVTGADLALDGVFLASADFEAVARGRLAVGGTVIANEQSLLRAADLTISATVTGVQGGIVQTTQGDLGITGSLRSNGLLRVLAAKDLELGAAARLVSAGGSIALSAGENAALRGQVLAFDRLAVMADSVLQAADLQAGLSAELHAQTIHQTGTLLSAEVSVKAASLFENAGSLSGQISLETGNLVNRGEIHGTDLKLVAASVHNATTGTLATDGSQIVDVSGQFMNDGIWRAKEAIQLTIGAHMLNRGVLDADGTLHIRALTALNTSGASMEAGVLRLDLTENLTNEGVLNAEHAAIVQVGQELRNAGQVAAAGGLYVQTPNVVNTGRFDAFGGTLQIGDLTHFDNRNGVLSSDTGIRLGLSDSMHVFADVLGDLRSNAWIVLEGQDGGHFATLTVGAQDQLVANGDLHIKAGEVLNEGTIASAAGNLVLSALSEVRNSGLVYAGGDWLSVHSDGVVRNDGGTLLSAGNMVLCGASASECLNDLTAHRAAEIINRDGGVIETLQGNIYLSAQKILNERAGEAILESSEPTNRTSVTVGRDDCSTLFCLGDDSDYYHKDITYDIITTLQLPGQASKMIAAGSVFLNADNITNAYSLISAQDRFVVEGGSLNNLGAESGVTSFYQRENWFYDDTYKLGGVDTLLSTEPAVQTGFVRHEAAFGTIEAGGTISGVIHNELNLGVISPNSANLSPGVAAPPGLAPVTQAASPLAVQGFVHETALEFAGLSAAPAAHIGALGISDDLSTHAIILPDNTAELVLAPSGVSGSPIAGFGGVEYPAGIATDMDLSGVSNSALFGVNPDPEAPYLVETRVEFIDQDAFIGSDYFLDSIGFDPERLQTRFGDALAETYLIRDQILALTGRRMLTGGLDEREQMRAMYDNAAEAMEKLHLRPGVALTPQQIAALKTDIIWLEERVVSGRTVLIPQVYLASTGRGGAFAAASLSGQNIDLSVGSLNNQGGTIAAGDALILEASGDIRNDFGAITAGGRLHLVSLEGDVLNLSGQIAGQDVYIAAQNIVSETKAIRFTGENGFTEIAAQNASIAASGQLELQALGDIRVVGADLFAGTGMRIGAGGNVDFAALVLQSQHQVETEHVRLLSRESISVPGSIVVSDGDLSITSGAIGADGQVIGGGNVSFSGTDVQVSGQMEIQALGGNVLLGAAQSISHSDSYLEHGDWFASKVVREERLEVTHQGTRIHTGQGLDIMAAGDIVDASSHIDAGEGQSVLLAGGNITMQSVTDIEAHISYTETKYLGGLLDFSREEKALSLTGQQAQAAFGGDLEVLAGGNLRIEGAQIAAEGEIATRVGGDTELIASVDTDFSDLKTHDNNSLLVTDIMDVRLTQDASFASLEAASLDLDPNSRVTIGLNTLQASAGAHSAGLLGVQDAQEQSEGIALTRYVLPEANAPPVPALYSALQDLSASSGGAEAEDGAPASGAYAFAGSVVEIGVPSAEDGAEFAIYDTLRLQGATVQDMELIQHQFYDQQTELGVVGQLIVQYIASTVTGGIGNVALQAAAQSAVSGVIEAAVTGDLDVENLLKDIAFSALTAGINEHFRLGELAGLPNQALLPFGNQKLTLQSIGNAVGHNLVSSGLSTAIYGTDFVESFTQGLTKSVVNLGIADAQAAVGDMVAGGAFDEGSVPHIALHAAIGCVGAELLNGQCGAGAAAGAASALFAGMVEESGAEAEGLIGEARLVSGLAGALASGGNADTALTAAGIGQSAFVNNYLIHAQREEAEELILALSKAMSACGSRRQVGGAACDEYDLIKERIEALQGQSEQNTAEMLFICGEDPNSASCQERLDEAKAYVAWADEAVGRSQFDVGLGLFYHPALKDRVGGNLDEIVVAAAGGRWDSGPDFLQDVADGIEGDLVLWGDDRLRIEAELLSELALLNDENDPPSFEDCPAEGVCFSTRRAEIQADLRTIGIVNFVAPSTWEGLALELVGAGAGKLLSLGGKTFIKIGDDFVEVADDFAINNVGVPIRQYPDGSFRTLDGKFASQGGLPAPGTKSAQEYTQYLRDNGFDVVGEELTVRGAVGNRRYDTVVRTDSGELWGIEYKSGRATKTPQQDFNDMYINQFGADGVGQLAGERVVGNITIYLP